MTDLFDLQNPVPSPGKPTALTVTFRRDRADRFFASVSTIRLFADNTIGGCGFAASAMQDPDYFAAFDAWWFEQDPTRSFTDRFQEFLRLYESGALR